jgi:hypothetical protein
MTNVDVAPGDVLLFHGKGFVSWAIRKFDGTEVNHAAIALGDGKFGEAAGMGLRVSNLDEAFRSNDFTIIKRFDTPPVDDVVTVANEYVKATHPYAYQQIVLLALLASTRKIPLPPIGRRFVRSALDHAAAALNTFLDKDGNKLMICSEYVYRCYEEAPGGPPPPYHLGILLGDQAFATTQDSLVETTLSTPEEELPETLPPPSEVAAVGSAAFDQAAEAELAPLIQAYAMETGLADDDLPEATGVASFEVDVARDVTDDELIGSLASFGAALGGDGRPVDFSIGGVIGPPVLKGAIEGIRHVSVEANFVTPGDLLRSPGLTEVGRVPRSSASGA